MLKQFEEFELDGLKVPNGSLEDIFTKSHR